MKPNRILRITSSKPFRYGLIAILFWGSMILYFFPAYADDGMLKMTPSDEIHILGTLPEGDFSTTLRLSASQTITNVRILVTDLHDATGDNQLRDPMPASSVELSPQPSFEILEAGSLTQIVVKVTKPTVSGIYTATLTVRWEEPERGQIELPLRVEARETPGLAVQDPEILAVNGRYTRQIRRHILLRESSGGTITGLQVLPQDLLKSGTNFVLPAHKIQATMDRASIGPGDLVTVTLNLNLSMVPAGEYSGKVVVKGDPDVFLTIPMTVKVADDWGGPFLVVIAGVSLGLWLTNYVAKGKVRDEYIVHLDRIRDAIRGDQPLLDENPTVPPEAEGAYWHENPQHGFSQSLQKVMVEIDAAIRAAEWTLAEEKLKSANALLVKWRSSRANWISQIRHLRQVIIGKLYSLDEEPIADAEENVSVPLQLLIRKTHRAIDTADTFDSPQDLGDEADAIIGLLQKFRKIHATLADFSKRLDALNPAESSSQEKVEALKQKLQRLKDDFDGLRIDNEAEVSAFGTQLNDCESGLSELEPSSEGAPESFTPTRAADAAMISPLHIFAPGLVPTDTYTPDAALARLQRYWFAAYFLAGFLLAMVGLVTIYLENETFGSNWLTDYLTLFLFGLGAETTVASMGGLLTRLGIQYK